MLDMHLFAYQSAPTANNMKNHHQISLPDAAYMIHSLLAIFLDSLKISLLFYEKVPKILFSGRIYPEVSGLSS